MASPGHGGGTSYLPAAARSSQASAVSNEFSARLAQRVLSSLQVLNSSLSEVRRTIARVDASSSLPPEASTPQRGGALAPPAAAFGAALTSAAPALSADSSAAATSAPSPAGRALLRLLSPSGLSEADNGDEASELSALAAAVGLSEEALREARGRQLSRAASASSLDPSPSTARISSRAPTPPPVGWHSRGASPASGGARGKSSSHSPHAHVHFTQGAEEPSGNDALVVEEIISPPLQGGAGRDLDAAAGLEEEEGLQGEKEEEEEEEEETHGAPTQQGEEEGGQPAATLPLDALPPAYLAQLLLDPCWDSPQVSNDPCIPQPQALEYEFTFCPFEDPELDLGAFNAIPVDTQAVTMEAFLASQKKARQKKVKQESAGGAAAVGGKTGEEEEEEEAEGEEEGEDEEEEEEGEEGEEGEGEFSPELRTVFEAALAVRGRGASHPSATVATVLEETHIVRSWIWEASHWPSMSVASDTPLAGAQGPPAEEQLGGRGGSGVAAAGADAALSTPSSANPFFHQAFLLPIVYHPGKTGVDYERDFKAGPGTIIAGRYEVRDCKGNAAFSTAWECVDLSSGEMVCLKVVKNNKDYLDQSLDEIKLLQYLNAHADRAVEGGCDALSVLRLKGFFYYKEHLFLVTELLKENLFDFYTYLSNSNMDNYFTIPRLQFIARQVLTALSFIHSHGILHCDLKPENILLKSYSRAEVKVRCSDLSSFSLCPPSHLPASPLPIFTTGD
jgi:hypothetical protein